MLVRRVVGVDPRVEDLLQRHPVRVNLGLRDLAGLEFDRDLAGPVRYRRSRRRGQMRWLECVRVDGVLTVGQVAQSRAAIPVGHGGDAPSVGRDDEHVRAG